MEKKTETETEKRNFLPQGALVRCSNKSFFEAQGLYLTVG